MAMQKIVVKETGKKMSDLGNSINWGYLADESRVIVCHKYDWHKQALYIKGNFLNKEVMIDIGSGSIPQFIGEYKVPNDTRLALLNKYGFYKRNRIYKSRKTSDEECFSYYHNGKYCYTRWLTNAVDWWYNPEGDPEKDWYTNGLSITQVERNNVPKVGLVQGRAAFGGWDCRWYMAADATLEEVKEALKKIGKEV